MHLSHPAHDTADYKKYMSHLTQITPHGTNGAACHTKPFWWLSEATPPAWSSCFEGGPTSIRLIATGGHQ
eukprot:8186934-Prorocentrum_lima.AAC.1